MTWAAWLLSLVGPMVVKVLLSLGISIVTYTGVTGIFDQMLFSAQSNWSSMPVAVLQLASIWGWPDFLGIVFGAAASRIALWASAAATRFVFK